MELPEDVLTIIKAYAQPMTRSDWRTLHKMTEYKFRELLVNESSPNAYRYGINEEYLYIIRFKHIQIMFRSIDQFF
jgi:hypothetical protein